VKNRLKKKFEIWCSSIKQKIQSFKREIGALYLAYKRPDVPLYAKLISIFVVGYSLSPIDLIPDFIPILGYLDDFILIPLGIALAIKLIPTDIMNECRQEAENIFKEGKPKNWVAGCIVICIWIIIISYILLKII